MNIRKQATSYLFGVILLFTGNVFAVHGDCPDPGAYPFNGCSVGELRPGGFPYFDQAVTINYKRKKDGFKVKAKYERGSNRSALLINPENRLSIDNTRFKLKARVSDGVASGWVRIKGSMDDFGISKKTTLMTADLEGPWDISGDNQLLGFNTTNIVCHEAFAEYCTQSESIYLSFIGFLDPEITRTRTTGIAVTTVPVPAAVWLFGSGLIGMTLMARRKRTNPG